MQYFDDLIRRYRDPIRDWVLREVRNPESSEDVTQEIFLKAYRFRDSYDPRLPFSSWLWAIARNAVKDWKRAAAGKSVPSLADPEAVDSIPEGSANAETLLMEKDDQREIRRAVVRQLRKLTPSQQRIFWLRFVKHLSYGEIAERLGLSLDAVKCAVYRARLTLNPA